MRRAAAARVESGVGDPAGGVVGVKREGDADEVAAGGAAGRARVTAVRPVAAGERALQVLVEALGVHCRPSVGRRGGPPASSG